MNGPTRGYTSVDEYITSFPKDVQAKLEELRRFIRRIVPEAEERISYQMPAYFLNGVLVYFGGHSHHIGFYPTSSGIRAFEKEISNYKHSKGAIQFPFAQPLPTALIEKIVRHRINENQKRTK